jgi:SSS family solute:Na+ symporter
VTGAIALFALLATITGTILYGRHKVRAKTVEEWALGGRRFGTLIFWFLNAGEIYTSFAVLGISGLAWASGAPAYIAFCSVSLSATLGYWLMPQIWSAGRRLGLLTQADFFAARYGARWLGLVVAIAGIAALLVYVQIQITALSLVLRLAVGVAITPLASAVSAAICMLAFVFLAGLRSAAFAAAIKDILMVLLVVALSVTVASHVGATSVLDVFARVQAIHPNIGVFPGLHPEEHKTTTWLMTSALNVALGTWIFPHMFQLCYSASDADTIRRNAMWQPLYSLSYFFIILLAWAALLAGTAPSGGDPNAVLLQFISDRYPVWMIGLFTGTACLLALVPGSVLLLTLGSIFSRNVVKLVIPNLSEKNSLLVSRGSMLLFAAIAVWMTLSRSTSLFEIGLTAYAAIGMLAPGVLLAFAWKPTNALGVFCGILAGCCILLLPAAEAIESSLLPEWEPGLIAIVGNTAVVFLVSGASHLVSARGGRPSGTAVQSCGWRHPAAKVGLQDAE